MTLGNWRPRFARYPGGSRIAFPGAGAARETLGEHRLQAEKKQTCWSWPLTKRVRTLSGMPTGNCLIRGLSLLSRLIRSILKSIYGTFGAAADPCDVSSRRKLDDVRPGGLGIHFIKSAVDKMEYDSPARGGMLLKMIKFRPKQEVGQN